MSEPAKPVKQKTMDDTLEDSFPASDPPSWSQPPETNPEQQLKKQDKESKGRPDEVHKEYSKEDFIDKK